MKENQNADDTMKKEDYKKELEKASEAYIIPIGEKIRYNGFSYQRVDRGDALMFVKGGMFILDRVNIADENRISISLTQAKELRGLLNTSGKDLYDIGKKPHGGWMYHEWKSRELQRFAKELDKKIKKLEKQLKNK